VITIVNTTIHQKEPSKRQKRWEKKQQLKKEMAQLTELRNIKPVFLNSPKDTRVSHIVEKKEERLRAIMDLNSLNQLANPEKFKTKGLGNSPRSKWDKYMTEFWVSKDKYTCSSVSDYEKKNSRYFFNHGIPMPVKRVPATSGIGRPDSDFLQKARLKAEKYKRGEKYTEVDETPIRMGGTIEKSNKHELK